MKVRKPDWLSDRIDWLPGQPREYCTTQIREAQPYDIDAIRALCRDAGIRPSFSSILRWLGQTRYTVRLVVRNRRHVIAICVTQHHPTQSKIRFCYVHPAYRAYPFEKRLLLSAALELPESPLAWTVNPADDEDRPALLSQMGWKFHANETDEDGKERHTYILPPFVGGRDRTDGAPDCAPFVSSAGDDEAGRDPGGDDEDYGAVGCRI